MAKKSVKKEGKQKKKKNSQSTISHLNPIPPEFGKKAADKVAKYAGSWTFILIFIGLLILWMIVNTTWLLFRKTWDPYPFILLNLVLSCLAALQAPIILMSQNRAAEKDRQRAEYDYAVNRKAEREIQQIRKTVNKIDRKIK